MKKLFFLLAAMAGWWLCFLEPSSVATPPKTVPAPSLNRAAPRNEIAGSAPISPVRSSQTLALPPKSKSEVADELFQKGISALGSPDRRGESIEYLEESLRNDPGNGSALFALVQAYSKTPASNQGEIFLLALLDNNPQDRDVLQSALADFYASKGDSVKAQYYAESAIESDPHSPVAHTLLGMIYAEKNDERAQAVLERSVELHREWNNGELSTEGAKKASVALGQLLKESGRTDEAQRLVSEAERKR